MASKPPKDATRFLKLLENVDYSDAAYSSRERGKVTFNVPGLGAQLAKFLAEASATKSEFANASGISVASLNSLLRSEHATDSMLFRLRLGVGAIIGPRAEASEDWIEVDSATRKRVDAVVKAVREFYSYVRARNSLDNSGGPLSPLERAQLIAVLEALVIELRAPAVSRNRLREVSRWLTAVAKRAATTTAEQELGKLGSIASSSIKALLRYVAGKAGLHFF